MSKTETVKVVLLGEAGVGKTCIISQFISGVFDADTISSLSAQFITKSLEFKEFDKVLKFEIWDTAGQERFRSLAKIFYKDAKVICLVYDVTSKKSFDELKNFWYEQVKDLGQILVVIANKCDLSDKKVKEEDGKKYAESIGAMFFEISCKENVGISNMFEKIAEAAKNKYNGN